MVNGYWIVSVFEIYYDFRVVDTFKITMRKTMVNDFWTVCIFKTLSELGT